MKATQETIRAYEYAFERKAIKWSAPSLKMREGVPQGVCIVNFVSADDRHPFHTTPIYGDQLDRAFWNGNTLCFNDTSREVEFEFLDD